MQDLNGRRIWGQRLHLLQWRLKRPLNFPGYQITTLTDYPTQNSRDIIGAEIALGAGGLVGKHQDYSGRQPGVFSSAGRGILRGG